MAGHIDRAATALRVAEREFRERAYGPFWDKVETAAREFATFDATIRWLAQDTLEYKAKLENQEHTFPPLPARLDELPDPAEVLREFARVVRLGQTDFEFASIWEHRRGAYVGQQYRLSEAVNDIGDRILNSIETFKASVSHA